MSNRAERRRQEKAAQKASVVYHLTQEQIDKMISEAVEKAMTGVKEEAVNVALLKTFQMFMCIPATVLHDKFGFGQVRMDRFMHYVMMWYESLQNGEVTMAEIRKMAEEATGVKVILDSIVDR